MEKYIFISYRSINEKEAFAFKELLERHNYDVWIAPNDIPIGSYYANIIEKAIRNCYCLLLIMTKDICSSQWINKELERAINYHKLIIGVTLEKFTLNDEFKFLLSNIQLSPLVKNIDDSDAAIKQILKDLEDNFLFQSEIKEKIINKHSRIEYEQNLEKSELSKIAKELLLSMEQGKEEIIALLSDLHFNDVNNYVKDFYEALPENKQNKISQNLLSAYSTIQLDENISGRKEYALKGQIIYYLTRLNKKNTSYVDKLITFYGREKNIYQRQSLAYGLASLNEYTIPYDFAQKIYLNRDEATVNRSWTLIFYGDVKNEDPYLYLDDGTSDWTNCREARINRLRRDEGKMAYRCLDFALLLNFYQSRDFKNIDIIDYKIIKNAKIIDKSMPKEIQKFNKKLHHELVKQLKKNLKNQ